MPLILLQTDIAAPPARCFDLSLDVDVHTASVASTRERVVAGVRSGCMALGDEITWEARHLGRTWRMTSRITEWERPARFVDEMVQGPFALFRHEHRFEPLGASGTRMVDWLDYRSPLGVLGWLADAAMVQRHLRAMLVMRNAHIARVAEGGV